MVFAFGGAILALPKRFSRTHALIAALMVTALALTGDWAAFGPGELAFRNGLSFGKVSGALQTAQSIGRILFGIGAALANFLALWAWVRFFLAFSGGAATRARSSS
jgi:hypothetical protein